MLLRPSTVKPAQEMPASCPRIALLTPYDGGNLGDAAIQDSMIANLCERMPGLQLLGITLGCDNFLKRHGQEAFPLLSASFSYELQGRAETRPDQTESESHPTASNRSVERGLRNLIRRALSKVPGLMPVLKKARAVIDAASRQILHSVEGYRVLRKQDLLIISGGGQLDDEWGGAWVHPFALCKWTLLARLAGVPCVMASVGVGKISSRASRRFISLALRMCRYRSYRETKTRAIAVSLLPRAANDSVVPDLAFSMPDSELPLPGADIRSKACGRTVIAISPIAFGKPGNWPTPDRALHDRYVQQMARLLSCLARRGYFVVILYSSLGDDESVIPEIMGHLGEEIKHHVAGQIHFPAIKGWKDLVTALLDVDYLVASRLHSTILGFVSRTPVVAISFDPKVDWVMEDLDQTDYLLQIRDFASEDVLSALDRMKVRRDAVIERITSYRQSILSASARQYDSLTRLALEHHQSHN
jgi:polysaccharide pyruvyl transferase WcaK-like protein